MSATILIVDDDHGLRVMLQALFEEDGYEVETAFDGLDALQKLETLSPALILLDINMPRMDGYALAAELERRGLLPGIQLMVLTAEGRTSEDAGRIAANGWVAKPFSVDRLLARVSDLLAS